MPVAAPNTQEVIDLLNSLWETPSGHYFSANEFQIRRLKRIATTLFNSEPAAAWGALAGAAALTGDADTARENADKAIRILRIPAAIDFKATPLSNLGYFSEAQPLCKQWLSIDALVWPHAADKAIGCASILHADEIIKAASNMPSGTAASTSQAIHLAASVLREHKITDEMVAGWLDVAGEIMREMRMFYLGFPRLFATREEGFAQVDVSFELDVNPEGAAELTSLLVTKCIERRIDPPNCFSFGFRSRRVADERIAA